MHYRVVFDLSQQSPPLWFPAFGLVFVAIGSLLWRLRDNVIWSGPFRSKPGLRKVFAGCFLGFSIFWTALVSVGVLFSHHSATGALRDGKTSVVEGVVENFHPMPYSGHDTERFTVGGVPFAYSDYIVVAGFHQTSSHGGPIREGLPVRIHYTGKTGDLRILRLEIRE